MSTLSTANITSKVANTPPVIKDVNGQEVGQFARVWVSFDGDPVTIGNSFGISSVTDTSTGQYTINFTTPFSDTNYAIVHGAIYSSGNGFFHSYYDISASSVTLLFVTSSSVYNDSAHVSAAFFGS